MAAEKVNPKRRLALGAMLLAIFMDFLDVSIINTAIPPIREALGASASAAQWVAAGYTLAFAVLLITGGRLGDLFGLKRAFMLGALGFTVASAVCGLAASPGMLIGARALQGAMAAVMVPQVFALIQTQLPPDERQGAFGLYGAVTALAVVLGGPIGGSLIQADILGSGWRSIFLLNVPIGIVALIAAAAFVRESEPNEARRLDLGGVALVTAGLLLLLYPVIEGRTLGWPVWAFVSMITALPVLGLFVLHERRKARMDGSPLLSLSLFRRRPFVVGLLMTLIFYAGVNSFFFILLIFLQTGLGYSPLLASLIGIPWPLGLAAASFISIGLVPKLGPRLLTLGMGVMAAGSLGLIATVGYADSGLGAWVLAPSLLVCGAGMGLVAPTLIDVIMSEVPAEEAGSGSGVLNSVTQLGAAVGVALIGVIFFGLLADATSPGDYIESFGKTLWYQVGVFVVGALLTFLVPTEKLSTSAHPDSNPSASSSDE